MENVCYSHPICFCRTSHCTDKLLWPILSTFQQCRYRHSTIICLFLMRSAIYLIELYRFFSQSRFSHTHSRSSSQSFNRKSSTMKCAVHFYDMLHSFGKAKHIFTLESTVRKFSFHIPPSFLSSNPHGFSFFFCRFFFSSFYFSQLWMAVSFCFPFFCSSFCYHFRLFFAAPSFSLALSSTLYFIFSPSLLLCVCERVICCLCHRQHFILPHWIRQMSVRFLRQI